MNNKSNFFFLDNYSQINLKNSSNKNFILNEFRDNKKNIFFIETLIYERQNTLKTKLLKKIYNFNSTIYKKIGKSFEIDDFNFLNINSTLHPDVMLEENDHYLILKCLLIEDIIKKYKFRKIYLNTKNIKILNFFQLFCKKYKIKLIDLNESVLKKKSYFFDLLKIFKNLLYYFYISIKFKNPIVKNEKTVFFGYLAHFNSKINDEISLDYWNGINQILKKNKINSNWFYFFYPTNVLRKIKYAKKYIKNQNQLYRYRKNYLIEEFISVSIIFKSVFQYIKIFNIKLKHKNYLENVIRKKDFVSICPINENFLKSLYGYRLLKNLIFFNVFLEIINKIKNSNKLIYLAENQEWEKFLNYFCKKYKINTLAFAHAGVREMDLRYYFLNKNFSSIKYISDNIVSHGEDTEIWLKEIKQTKKKIKLEALRLNRGKFHTKIIKNIYDSKKEKNCLIFLDIYDLKSSPIMNIIKILKQSKNLDNIYLKLHPTANPLLFKKKYPFAKIISFNKFPRNINLVISGSNTTASYFAYYNRLPLYIFLRSGYINMLPYFKKYNFKTFFDASSLLREINKKIIIPKNFKNIHYFKKKIPRWEKLLKSN